MTHEITYSRDFGIVVKWEPAKWATRVKPKEDALRWIGNELTELEERIKLLGKRASKWHAGDRIMYTTYVRNLHQVQELQARINVVDDVFEGRQDVARTVWRIFNAWKCEYPTRDQMRAPLPAKDYPNAVSPTTEQEHDMNFTIKVTEVKAGWVGQILGKAYAGAPKDTIVWESEPFTDDEDYEYDESTETYKGQGGYDKALKAAQGQAEKVLANLFA